MPDDDGKARRTRARHLREEIASLKMPRPAPGVEADEEKPEAESPRAFIERAMREKEERANSDAPAAEPGMDRRGGEDKKE
jgi:hypothetical protein